MAEVSRITLRALSRAFWSDTEGVNVSCCRVSFGSVSRMTLGVSAGVTLEMIEIVLWSDLEDVSEDDSGVISGVTSVVWVVI